MQERFGAITLGGTPLTLLGPALQVGQKAPNFSVTGNDMRPFTLADTAGKIRILASLGSLDTPVCDTETRRFNQEATSIPVVEILTVSMDLPFAQARWCGSAGVKNVRTLSDYKDRLFGLAYGVLTKESQLLGRAVFLVDKGDVLRHVEYVKEIGDQPDYAALLYAARKLAL